MESKGEEKEIGRDKESGWRGSNKKDKCEDKRGWK